MTKNDQYVNYFSSITFSEVIVAYITAYLYKMDEPFNYFCTTNTNIDAVEQVTQYLSINEQGDILKSEIAHKGISLKFTINLINLRAVQKNLLAKETDLTASDALTTAILKQLGPQIWHGAMLCNATRKEVEDVVIQRFISLCNISSYDPIKYYEQFLIPYYGQCLQTEKNTFFH